MNERRGSIKKVKLITEEAGTILESGSEIWLDEDRTSYVKLDEKGIAYVHYLIKDEEYGESYWTSAPYLLCFKNYPSKQKNETIEKFSKEKKQ